MPDKYCTLCAWSIVKSIKVDSYAKFKEAGSVSDLKITLKARIVNVLVMMTKEMLGTHDMKSSLDILQEINRAHV